MTNQPDNAFAEGAQPSTGSTSREATSTDRYKRGMSQVVARAWADSEFKARLLLDANSALREFGLTVEEGATVQFHESTASNLHFVLPPPPDGLTGEFALDQGTAIRSFESAQPCCLAPITVGGDICDICADITAIAPENLDLDGTKGS